MARPVALLAGVLVAVLAFGCSDDSRESYCAAVEDHQTQLAEQTGRGGPTALIAALPTFRSLAEEAPPDIADEWELLIDRVAGLEAALDAAGVDPAAYDAEQPPDDLARADRDRIAEAARELGSEQSQRALADLEQQARDVCKTPLVL